ncbi:methyltransferase [soil metagenome]
MDSARVAALRSDLGAARFTVESLTQRWGAVADAALLRGDRVPARRALAGNDDPAAVLARLFVLGLPEKEAAVARALPALGIGGARDLQLITHAGGLVHPLLDLRPYAFLDARGAGEWFIASDLGELATGAALRTDHVLGVGGASITLSGLIMPGRVATALDLGTGCGIQALHLAREAEHVVATDISERALEFARLNAALNGVTSIEFRQGSFFEPVAGERFERIVSNPPFVITPRVEVVPEYEYRDGGAVGDAVVEQLVAAMPEYLEPGGIAQLLGNWEDRGVTAGLDRAGRWAADAGLDAWIIERESVDTARYAETWIRDGGTRPDSSDTGAASYEQLVGAWLDDFASRDVTRIGFGYLTLRRPPTSGKPTLTRLEKVDAPLDSAAGGLGAHLALTLAAIDAQASLDADELDALHLAVASDVTEERSHWPGAADPSVILLRQGGGLRREMQVGTALAAVVGACDGELSLGAITGAVASILDVDRQELADECRPQVREMISTGFLLIE